MDRKLPKSIDQFVNIVNNSFYDHDDALGNFSFSLKQAMIRTLEAKGDSTYLLKHMGKEKMRREGTLGLRLPCPYQLHKLCYGNIYLVKCMRMYLMYISYESLPYSS